MGADFFYMIGRLTEWVTETEWGAETEWIGLKLNGDWNPMIVGVGGTETEWLLVVAEN
jgi:hypothetical protein